MTDIPGTGKIKLLEKKTQEISSTPLSVVNVNELKRKKEDPSEVDSIWYEKFHFWLIFGIVISLIFLIISFKYKGFLALIPLGPIAAIISWYIKKIVKKLEPKPKKYSA